MVDLLVIVFGLGIQFLIVGQRSAEFFRPASTQQFAQRPALIYRQESRFRPLSPISFSDILSANPHL